MLRKPRSRQLYAKGTADVGHGGDGKFSIHEVLNRISLTVTVVFFSEILIGPWGLIISQLVEIHNHYENVIFLYSHHVENVRNRIDSRCDYDVSQRFFARGIKFKQSVFFV